MKDKYYQEIIVEPAQRLSDAFAEDGKNNELTAMSRAQFLKELKLRGNGNIASILLYTGAFEVRET